MTLWAIRNNVGVFATKADKTR